MTNRLEDDVYFILKKGEVIDWTTNLEEAREYAADDEYRYKRYSENPLDRKPFERVRGDEYQRLDTLGD